MKKIVLIALFFGLLLTGCFLSSSKTDQGEQVLARVDSKTVTAAQLDSIAEAKSIVINDTTDVKALKTELLDTLIDNALIQMRQDSIALTLDNDLAFSEKRNDDVSNAVFRMMFEGEISNKVKIDSSEVLQYYQDHLDQFKNPEQVKASHILIPPPPPDTAGVKDKEKIKAIINKNDQETKKRAEAVFDKAKKGENWDSLVVKYSQDATNNKKGGDLGYFPRGRMVPAFDSAAFAGQVGEIIGPVKTRFGYHIIKIVDKKPEEPRELNEELRADIEKQLTKTKERDMANEFLDSLKTRANYVFNEPILALPDSGLDPATWVMIVNSTDTVYEDRLQKEFYKYLRHYGIADTAWTIDTKKDMLKDISVTYLLRAAGKKLGYFEMPKAIEEYDDFTNREAELRTKNSLRDLEYSPSEDEIEQFFNANFEERYKEKKPLHIQHIIFKDSAEALVIRDSILAGADFKEMALKYYPGEPEIREVAYDLGYISEKELGPEFFDYVNTLKVGDVSLPFKTEWGYHIVKLVDRREDKKLDQVRPGIRKALIEAADAKVRNQYLSQRRLEVPIVIEEKALKKHKFPESLYSVEITPKG
jgi:peptidyl-prolyl cis-trans isomerase C